MKLIYITLNHWGSSSRPGDIVIYYNLPLKFNIGDMGDHSLFKLRVDGTVEGPTNCIITPNTDVILESPFDSQPCKVSCSQCESMINRGSKLSIHGNLKSWNMVMYFSTL